MATKLSPCTTQLVSRGKTYEGSEVMDSWKTHFQDLPSPTLSSSFDDTFQSTITEEFQHLLTIPPDEDITVSPGEVAKAIESLAFKKAPGPDEFEAEHPHFGGPSLIIHLTNICNAILATGHIPAPFLHGKVIPIPKGHDRDLRDPSNYRGISLLSSISKVLEKVLINIISPDITLNPLQGGFRSGYSCLHTTYILQ